MEELVPILILGTYFGLMLAERLWPARALPVVRGWTARGLGSFAVALLVNGAVPALVAAGLDGHTLLSGASLGLLGGALCLFLISELIFYALHRTYHTVPALWRWVHQLHHSAERVDMLGSAFVHPSEVALTAGMSSLAVAVLGVTPEAAALGGVIGTFFTLFNHANIKTPVWLGYLIQRPESHSVHHARGVHAYNYANLPVIDLLFGTFRNPAGFVEQAGFWDGASAQVGAMLIGRDVAEQPQAQPQARPAEPAMSGAAAVGSARG